MENLTVLQKENTSACQEVGTELFDRFLAYLDASPKTIETYTRSLRQLFHYFVLNNIKQPRREDILAFRENLTASGHKPT